MQLLNLRIPLFSMIVALMVLLMPCLTVGAESAGIMVLDKPAEELTREDLQEFVELASSNQINAAQVQAFIAKLTPEQEQTLRKLSEAKIQADSQKKAKSSSSKRFDSAEPIQPAYHGIPWLTDIEYQDPNGSPTLP